MKASPWMYNLVVLTHKSVLNAMVLSVSFSVYGFYRNARTSSGVNVFHFIVIPPNCIVIIISSVTTISPYSFGVPNYFI